MADRKEELKKSMEAGKSIIANKFAKKEEQQKKKDDPKAYKDAVNSWNKTKNMPFVQSSSLVANKFANDKKEEPVKKEPTVKTATKTDYKTTTKIDDTNIGFKSSALSDKTFDGKTPEFNIDFGTDNKKVGGPFDKTLDALDNITNENAEASKLINNITNPDTGDVDVDKAKKELSEYQRQLIEKGHAGFDKDGKFVLKPVGKGWETWATLLSVGLSAVGLAMGVPIIPINFRAITGKDANDAERRSQQQQYLNILAENFNKIEGMNADVEAGKIAMENQDALAAQEKHAQATAAQKDVIGAQTDASKQLIDKQTESDMKKARLKFEQDKDLAQIANKHAMDFAQLQSDLSTMSAKDIMGYSKYGWVQDAIKTAKEKGLSNGEIARGILSYGGVTPTQGALKNMQSIVDMWATGVGTVSNAVSNAGDLLKDVM